MMHTHARVLVHRQDGTTPLILAAYKGHLEIVRLLVDRAADINATEEVHAPCGPTSRSYGPAGSSLNFKACSDFRPAGSVQTPSSSPPPPLPSQPPTPLHTHTKAVWADVVYFCEHVTECVHLHPQSVYIRCFCVHVRWCLCVVCVLCMAD